MQEHTGRDEGSTCQAEGDARPGVSRVPGPRRVLLAEDDATLRRLLAAVLRADGYEVVEAADGVELLTAIEATLAGGWVHPALFVIVADVHMPGLTGLDVLAVLRCANAPTPVVLITAFADREARAEAIDLGAVALLAKPFPVDELRAVVRDAAPPLG